MGIRPSVDLSLRRSGALPPRLGGDLRIVVRPRARVVLGSSVGILARTPAVQGGERKDSGGFSTSVNGFLALATHGGDRLHLALGGAIPVSALGRDEDLRLTASVGWTFVGHRRLLD